MLRDDESLLEYKEMDQILLQMLLMIIYQADGGVQMIVFQLRFDTTYEINKPGYFSLSECEDF